MSRFNREIGILKGQISKLEIQKKRKDRINVYLDGQYAFSCHIDFVFEYKLDKGLEVTPDLVKRLVEEDDYKMAYLYGLKIALTRNISINGCRRKLIQLEFSEAAVSEAINRLVENDALNDIRFAHYYYEIKQNLYGQHRIQMELNRQGVDKAIIRTVLDEMRDEEFEYQEALRYAYKKFDPDTQVMDQKNFAKVYGFLARKGYNSGSIRRVMDFLRTQSKKNYDAYEEES